MPEARTLVPDSPLLRAAMDACAARGVRVWLVGGSVRDALLARPIHDFDLAVEREAIAAARDCARRLDAPMYVLDAERDTARVVTRAEDGTRVFLDFARLRDATLEGDLVRRDFTINALAIDPAQPDTLIDPFGGRRDLDARLIRAVTDQSLVDDPARLLRAVRLSLGLSFAIEPTTRGLIQSSAHGLKDASAERVRDEAAHIVALPGLYRGIGLMDELGLLGGVLPEVAALKGVDQSPPHHWDVFEHTRRMIDVLELALARAGIETQAHEPIVATAPESIWPDVDGLLGPLRAALREHFEKPLSDDRPAWLALKWAALLHDAGKPRTRSLDADGRIRSFEHEDAGAQMAIDRLRALRFSNEEVERAALIIRYHMRPHHLQASGVSRRAAYRFFRDTGEAGVDVLLHGLADHLATHGPDLDAARWAGRLGLTRSLLDEYFHRHKETVNPPPLIDGQDVMAALKLKPGRQVGRILEAVREAQAAGEVTTREEALAMAGRVNSDQ